MRILIFDSGLGGLTVFRHIRALAPGAQYFYAADDAAFPVGAWPADELARRTLDVVRKLETFTRAQAIVVACNTISTLALPHLRAAFPRIPIIGTVPAIKPAAERTKSGLISVLATPGTVARDYTQDLIASFAAHCQVQLVGSSKLAVLAEAFMRQQPVDEAVLSEEIAPAFVERGGNRTDVITLACTHYPLLLPMLEKIAPWPVEWIDPGPAIARRTLQVLRETFGEPVGRGEAPSVGQALFTSGVAPGDDLAAVLAQFGLISNHNFQCLRAFADA